MNTITDLRKIFDGYLQEYNFVDQPASLYEPMDYIMRLGGKRFRPLLVLLASDMFSDDVSKSLPAALALEVFHNFTLVHDDIMDDADTRRGKATVHAKYNNNTAILSGDVMLIKAYDLLGSYKDAMLKSQIYDVFNKFALELCEGQQMDIDFESMEDVSVEDYLKMISLKTGVLIAGSLQIGAIIGEAKAEDAKHLYDFGKNLGMAFQIQDDLLDTFGTFEKVGKKIGGDIVQNKKTYLYLKSLELSSDSQRQELVDIYNNRIHLEESEKIEKVTKIFERLVVAEYARQLRDAYLDLAYAHLSAVRVPDRNKEEIRSIAKQLVNRDF